MTIVDGPCLYHTALYVYERIITLDEDITLVWLRRWTGVTVLYAILHVCVIAFLMATLAGYFVVSCTVSPCMLAPSVTDRQTEVGIEYHIHPLPSSPVSLSDKELFQQPDPLLRLSHCQHGLRHHSNRYHCLSMTTLTVTYAISIAITTLRVYAISGKNWRISAVVVALFIVEVADSLV